MRLKRIVPISLVTVSAIFCLYAYLMAEVIDKIVAVVNNEVVTQREMDRVMEPIYEQYRSLYGGDQLSKKIEEATDKVLEQLIEDRLILSEAKKKNIEVDEKEVAERMEEVEKKFRSRKDFEAALVEQGTNLSELKNRSREQMMVRKMIDQKIGPRITVSPVETREYYDKHIDEFSRPEELRVRNILIKPKEGRGPEKSLELAREILRRLREGGDFGGLAKEYSDGPGAAEGGLMDSVKRGDLLPEIEKVIFSLNAQEVSGIIQTSGGYHIFKVEERIPRATLDLSLVRRDVEETVYKQKAHAYLKEWIQALRKNAYIEFK